MSFGTLILTAGQTFSDLIVLIMTDLIFKGIFWGFFVRVRGILLTDLDLASHISLGEVESILGNRDTVRCRIHFKIARHRINQ